MRRHLGTFAFLVAIVLTVLPFAPTLIEAMRIASDPWRFQDDARNCVFPFYRFENNAFVGDFLADYSQATVVGPLAFKAIMSLAGMVGGLELLTKSAPFILLLVTLLAVGSVAHAVAGRIGVLTSIALILGSRIWLERMAGTVPRAFAFPLCALGLLALYRGRARILVALVIVAGALYPVAAATLGLSLAFLLFIVPRQDRGDASAWAWTTRAWVLAGTVGALIVLSLPTLLAASKYGGPVLARDIAAYPEAGPSGTHGDDDRPPYPSFTSDLGSTMKSTLVGAGEPLVRTQRVDPGMIGEILVLILGLGVLRLARDRREIRRILCFAGAVVAGHLLARIAAPYLYAPSRYVLYPAPPLLVLLLPIGVVGLIEAFEHRPWRRWIDPAVLGTACLAFVLYFGGRGKADAGMSVHIGTEEQRRIEAVRALPPTAYIAGWPDDPMSNIVHLSKRRVFMSGEMHFGYHKGYLETVRLRMRDFFAAYFAASPERLIAFREKYGVTHILLEYRHLKENIGYMPPLGQSASDLRSQANGQFLLLSDLERTSVFRDERFALIDLSRF